MGPRSSRGSAACARSRAHDHRYGNRRPRAGNQPPPAASVPAETVGAFDHGCLVGTPASASASRTSFDPPRPSGRKRSRDRATARSRTPPAPIGVRTTRERPWEPRDGRRFLDPRLDRERLRIRNDRVRTSQRGARRGAERSTGGRGAVSRPLASTRRPPGEVDRAPYAKRDFEDRVDRRRRRRRRTEPSTNNAPRKRVRKGARARWHRRSVLGRDRIEELVVVSRRNEAWRAKTSTRSRAHREPGSGRTSSRNQTRRKRRSSFMGSHTGAHRKRAQISFVSAPRRARERAPPPTPVPPASLRDRSRRFHATSRNGTVSAWSSRVCRRGSPSPASLRRRALECRVANVTGPRFHVRLGSISTVTTLRFGAHLGGPASPNDPCVVIRSGRSPWSTYTAPTSRSRARGREQRGESAPPGNRRPRVPGVRSSTLPRRRPRATAPVVRHDRAKLRSSPLPMNRNNSPVSRTPGRCGNDPA